MSRSYDYYCSECECCCISNDVNDTLCSECAKDYDYNLLSSDELVERIRKELKTQGDI